jgi:hypothetical protein
MFKLPTMQGRVIQILNEAVKIGKLLRAKQVSKFGKPAEELVLNNNSAKHVA